MLKDLTTLHLAKNNPRALDSMLFKNYNCSEIIIRFYLDLI